MKSVSKIVFMVLLAAVFAACESGGGSGTSPTPTPTPTSSPTPTPTQVVNMLGTWAGAWRSANGHVSGGIRATVTSQDGRTFSGMVEAYGWPIPALPFVGTLGGDQPPTTLSLTTTYTKYWGGTLSDANNMGGSYEAYGGLSGYWQMVRQE